MPGRWISTGREAVTMEVTDVLITLTRPTWRPLPIGYEVRVNPTCVWPGTKPS